MVSVSGYGKGELLEMAIKENKKIKEAVKSYNELSGDEEVKRLAEVRLMAQLEEKSALASEREQGIAVGRAEGEKNKQIEIAKKMKEQEIPTDKIEKVTGLTKEEIEKL